MFLFHFYHFHHIHHDTYCFESFQHKLIRHAFENMVKHREIEEALHKLGLQDNMQIQHYCIYNC